MEYKLKALSIYEFGQRKDKNGNPHQEDWIYPALGSINNEKDRLFILCDGMGGHAAGEVASATVCEAMSKTIMSSLEKGEKFSEKLLLKALDAAYNLLDERDTSEDASKKMGTTMTFLMFHENGFTIAHIGDSRVYHIRPNTGKKADIVFQTVDHSLVNDLLKIGELTPEEAETYPHKNVITRAMQPNLEHRHKADIVTSKNIKSGDYFYMCSDGMLEQTSNDNLCFMLNNDVSDEEKRDMLIKVSKNNKDNHSAHLIHILDVQPSSEIEEAQTPPPSDSITEDDGEFASIEFDNTPNEDNDESTKASTLRNQASTAASGVAKRTFATFRRWQKVNHNDKGRNKLVWRVFVCLVALLAICGVLFTKFPEKKEVVSPQGEEHLVGTINSETTKPSANKTTDTPAPTEQRDSSNSDSELSSEPVDASSNSTTMTPSLPPASHPSSVETNHSQNQQQPVQGAVTPDSASRLKNVQNALQKRQDSESEGAVTSVETQVLNASNPTQSTTN